MSIERVAQEILRFLSSDEPEVLCLRGDWGVGKTYAWKHYLLDAKKQRKIVLNNYSYVSLFGLNSLEELRYAIFENSIQVSAIGIDPSLATLRTNTTDVVNQLGKKSLSIIQQHPWVKSHLGALGPVWFLSVSRTIICMDDLERRGKNLAIRDVLGLVLNLKEHKRCKVLLILNDEALKEEEAEFQTFFEKVVDVYLQFVPSPKDSVRIALKTEKESEKLLAECCETLGISNIRVIKKIERLIGRVEPLLAGYDQKILRQAVRSLALLGWSVYEPRKAPSLKYLKTKKMFRMPYQENAESVSEEEAAWDALLQVYGFATMDVFDGTLLGGVENGFFDEALMAKCAAELDRDIKAGNAENAFTEAWSLYHDSFDDNAEETLDAIYGSFMSTFEHISPLNVNGTVRLFKNLGRSAQAAELIKRYVEGRKEGREFFDLERLPFGSEINDPDLIQAFKQKWASFPIHREPGAILLEMERAHGWSQEDLAALAAVSVDGYVETFKTARGDDLAMMIAACRRFAQVNNPSHHMEEVARRAIEALQRIGQESPINAMRVRKFGVNVPDATSVAEGNQPS